ncbi:MAG: 1,4-dihydroxy-2-naphthoate octaprenyltransferase [Chloroflexi bacterium]|nr:1,4-dihydroxy-2-naphthoate octaprenyltransferase [Chloroflexota bacterium]
MLQKVISWYWAARPFTLSASIVPIALGSALAFRDGKATLLLFALMLLASMLVQVTANLVDEYTDHGRPEGRDKLPAPYKVIALGKLSAREVKVGAAVCFGVATVIGLYMVSVAGWPVLAICLGGAAAAYFYSAGPRPLGKAGLGHPLVFLFMGPAMVMGTAYVYYGAFTLDPFLASLPVGFTIAAILAANDLRDMEEDLAAGKRTPATIFGRNGAKKEWAALVAGAFVTVAALVWLRVLEGTALLAMFALPVAAQAFRVVLRGENRQELAPALRISGRLNLLFGLLLSAGIALRFVR